MNNDDQPNTSSSPQEDIITTNTSGFATPDTGPSTAYTQPIADAMDSLLQNLLTEASELRKLQNSAKTHTKRDFYNKKFKKLSKQIVAMVASRGFVSEYIKTAAKKKEVEDVIDTAK